MLERNIIEDRQKQEKEKAEQDLYAELDEDSKFKGANKEKDLETEVVIPPKYDKPAEDDGLEDIVPEEPKRKTNYSNDIFNSDEISAVDHVEKAISKLKNEGNVPVPGPRKAATVQVPFTEKIYPHMATRESHLNEPPLPKTTQINREGKVFIGVYVNINVPFRRKRVRIQFGSRKREMSSSRMEISFLQLMPIVVHISIINLINPSKCLCVGRIMTCWNVWLIELAAT